MTGPAEPEPWGVRLGLPAVGGVPIMRVLLVDEHRMLTEALATRLSAVRDVWVAGICTLDDPGLAEVARRPRPDVITTEVGPDPAGTSRILRSLAQAQPSARLVVLTDTHDPAHAVAAAREGAVAWVGKDSSIEHLLKVLRAVCQGHAWYPAQYLGAVLRGLRDDTQRAHVHGDRLSMLSDREREVLLGMINGKPVSAIAMESLISPNTVRTHVRSIFTKLGVHSRLEAVRVARDAGLRPAPEPPRQALP